MTMSVAYGYSSPPCFDSLTQSVSLFLQQLDPPHEELLSSALQSIEVELGKLAEIPWLYHILQPNDEEVSTSYRNREKQKE